MNIVNISPEAREAAEHLHTIGWRSPNDAQWHKFNEWFNAINSAVAEKNKEIAQWKAARLENFQQVEAIKDKLDELGIRAWNGKSYDSPLQQIERVTKQLAELREIAEGLFSHLQAYRKTKEDDGYNIILVDSHNAPILDKYTQWKDKNQ